MCDVLQSLRAILTVGLFIAAQCQRIDRSVFEDGDSFNLTCDANRIGDVPAAVTEISQLTIEKAVISNTGTMVTVLAKYLLLPSEEKMEKSIPKGRHWLIEVSGGKNPSNLENRATLKIILHVPDAKCSDAGLYACKAVFHPTDGVSEASRSDTLTYKARLGEPMITLDHHTGNAPDVSNNTVGQEVKLTCTFEGLAGLELTWLIGASGGTNVEPYPNDGVEMVTPSPTSDPCGRGKYESTLTFRVPAVDTTYICVAKDGDNGARRKNFKIVFKRSTDNKGTHLGIMDSNWLVRNMLVMVVLPLVATLMWSRFV